MFIFFNFTRKNTFYSILLFFHLWKIGVFFYIFFKCTLKCSCDGLHFHLIFLLPYCKIFQRHYVFKQWFYKSFLVCNKDLTLSNGALVLNFTGCCAFLSVQTLGQHTPDKYCRCLQSWTTSQYRTKEGCWFNKADKLTISVIQQ